MSYAAKSVSFALFGALLCGSSIAHAASAGDTIIEPRKVSTEMVLARFDGMKTSVTETTGDVVLVAQPALVGSGVDHAARAMILSDGSVAAGKIKIEVAGPAVPAALRVAMAQEALENAGGNVFALAGNDGGIKNATSAVLRDGHVWLTAPEKTTPVQTASAETVSTDDVAQN